MGGSALLYGLSWWKWNSGRQLLANTAGKRQVVPVPVVQAPLCIRSTHFGEGTVPNSSPDSCQAAQPSGAQSVFN